MGTTQAEICMDKESVRRWEMADREDNRAALDRARAMLSLALREYVSEKQRIYMLAYFSEELTMQEIAERYGVHRSTVSRMINAGLDRLYDCLRFTDPAFAELKDIRDVLKIDRKKGCKQRRYKRTRKKQYKNRVGKFAETVDHQGYGSIRKVEGIAARPGFNI